MPSALISTLPGTHLATFDVENLSWSIAANGGFQTAQWSKMATVAEVESALQQGLGAHVEMRDEVQVIRWEGRVNQILVTLGGIRWSWGPLLQMSNQAAVRYTITDTTTTPPTQGEQRTTAWGNNDDSQYRFGISQAILSTGALTDAQATQYRDLWLADYAWPALSSDVGFGSGTDQAVIQYNAAGYSAWLNYPYNQYVNTGTRALSSRIEDILDADPNGFFSSANADIATNALAVTEYENQDRKAWDLLMALVAAGDAGLDRYTLSVKAGRRVVYAQIPDDVEYQMSLGDAGHYQIRTLTGALVRPWAVEPGKWAVLTDILPGQAHPTTTAERLRDPRYMFIERVQMTLPDSVQIQSGQILTEPQAMAQWGLGGTG